jgi:phosphoribosylaminoimidazole-succinocarboxamide synthase
MVASDRVSAFDVILPQPVPRKGEVLTLISAWWFARTADLVPNHLLSVNPDYIADRYTALATTREVWSRRAMLVRKLEPFPVECVVRGYVAGSAWKEYRATGTLAGEALPSGLIESARLETPIFSPATKAEEGHDENITFEQAAAIVGVSAAEELRRASILLYERGRDIALQRGIIIADTKFEFGLDNAGTVRVMDEILTPDSSRFWPSDIYEAGQTQPSFDKQPVRDYLEDLVQRGLWDRQPPAPDLPDEQVAETSRRYQEAFRRITGIELDEVPLSGWGGT